MRPATLAALGMCLVLALVLTALEFPASFPAWLGWLRPDWVALVVLYWVIAVPQQVGMGTAWVSGIFVDSMTGNLLGQHALGLVLIAWAGLTLYERLRMYATLQQALIVFVTVSLAQSIDMAIEIVVRDAVWSWWVLVPALTSAMLWPLAFNLQRALRRRMRVR
ncbi:MAG: rod shape-determining protein MreD [Pseudomonadota bacterium]|nr:rod shape-determining protein MreD [Pseudomonadota bacterium]